MHYCYHMITCNITHIRHHIRIGWAPVVFFFMKNKTTKDINYTLVLIWKQLQQNWVFLGPLIE